MSSTFFFWELFVAASVFALTSSLHYNTSRLRLSSLLAMLWGDWDLGAWG